jgi:glyoxylase-like metal-dependent hydrolase (beta-lactamase superfamily II)
MNEIPRQQVPGIYHRRVGDIVVTALSDGYLDITLDVTRNLPVAEGEKVLASNFQPSGPRCSVNAYAVRVGDRLALIETGSGNTMGPTLGWLQKNLKLAGIDAAKIKTVLLTHVHPDHSNGLTNDAGERLFPECELVVHENEITHWHDDAQMAKVPERQAIRYFQGARIQLAPYRKQLRTFRSSGEVFPGITAVPIPGHTPGHTAYLISSGSESLLIWGDTVHIPDLQVPHPEVCMEFDSDQAAAAATRRRVFDMVATDRLLVAGMHLHFPGFAHMTRGPQGYTLLPEAWKFEI